MERGGLYFPLGNATPAGDRGPTGPPTSKRAISPQRLDVPLTVLPGVGRVLAGRFAALGIHCIRDLLLYLPFRHEPPSRLCSVSALKVGEAATIRVRVRSCSVRPSRRRNLRILEALLGDDSGTVLAVWYNQAYLEDVFAARPELLVRGAITHRAGPPRFIVQSHEVLSGGEEGLHTLGLVPVYPATGEVSVRLIRSTVAKAREFTVHLVDPLPARLVAKRRYPSRCEAVMASHFPRNESDALAARRRLAFEELLLLQLALLQRRARQKRSRVRPLPPPGSLCARFLASLPFQPTPAQRRVMAEIDSDLMASRPMLRLLQGDVGSGKTLVAVYALLRAVEAGGQAALMAPTEVLVDQHALRLSQALSSLGLDVGTLKSSMTAGERRAVTGRLAAGELQLVVGTHALIQSGVHFADLRAAVVDEQHRFGVRQRDALGGEANGRPHVLHMTATPIPRTLCLTLYGDLDLSVLDELPPGRTPVRTVLVPPVRQAAAWKFVRERVDEGEQACVVCPLIEESATVDEASATAVYAELAAGELGGYRVGLLHGNLPSAQKREAMADFAAGRTQVLVSTTVIEVGVDVPNATVMLILGARRFGLSQLHQLRGRVGRGSRRSYCLLFTDEGQEDADGRLGLFASTSDGFELAEADLRLRGEGQMFGDRQSGFGDLRVARLLHDQDLLQDARREAQHLLAADPLLERTAGGFLREEVTNRFGGLEHWLDRA